MELDGLTKAYLTQLTNDNPDPVFIDRLASNWGLVSFYKNQLKKFNKVGLGNRTEFDVMVTPQLISATIRRLEELYSKKVKKHITT